MLVSNRRYLFVALFALSEGLQNLYQENCKILLKTLPPFQERKNHAHSSLFTSSNGHVLFDFYVNSGLGNRAAVSFNIKSPGAAPASSFLTSDKAFQGYDHD